MKCPKTLKVFSRLEVWFPCLMVCIFIAIWFFIYPFFENKYDLSCHQSWNRVVNSWNKLVHNIDSTITAYDSSLTAVTSEKDSLLIVVDNLLKNSRQYATKQ